MESVLNRSRQNESHVAERAIGGAQPGRDILGSKAMVLRRKHCQPDRIRHNQIFELTFDCCREVRIIDEHARLDVSFLSGFREVG